jgi:hypothetical protein
VARVLLLAAALLWALGALVGAAIAALGVNWLEALLPPLAIDTEALRGAIVAVAVALALGSAAHVAVLAGLRARRPRAWSAGILLAAVLSVTFVALAAAAATSSIATPASAAVLLGAGAAATLAALGYGIIVARLVAELRSGSVI